MNPVYQKIAENARFFFPEPSEKNTVIRNLMEEMFDGIVMECIDVVNSVEGNTIDKSDIETKIRQHFGF